MPRLTATRSLQSNLASALVLARSECVALRRDNPTGTHPSGPPHCHSIRNSSESCAAQARKLYVIMTAIHMSHVEKPSRSEIHWLIIRTRAKLEGSTSVGRAIPVESERDIQ